jgi:hypothetical protein
VAYSFGPRDRIVTDSLLLYLDAANPSSYPGTGNIWYDLSSNKKHGTLINGATFDSANRGSIVFDGTDDYVSIGSIGTIPNFTVLVWFYPYAVQNFQNVLDCNYDYNMITGNLGPRLELTNGGVSAFVYSNDTENNSNFYNQRVTNSGIGNTWYNFGIVYNSVGNTSLTYYNGNPTGIGRIESGLPTGFLGTMNNVNLGRGFSIGGSERMFTGRIANIVIYNRALSESEILQNYNALKSRFGL